MKAALDTNILLRLLTADNEAALRKAQQLVSAFSSKELFVSYGVLTEVYFVLTSRYKWEPSLIFNALESVLNTDQFSVENETAVRLALAKARKGQPFYDSLIGEIAAVKNLKTYTFDQKLKTNSSFVVI